MVVVGVSFLEVWLGVSFCLSSALVWGGCLGLSQSLSCVSFAYLCVSLLEFWLDVSFGCCGWLCPLLSSVWFRWLLSGFLLSVSVLVVCQVFVRVFLVSFVQSLVLWCLILPWALV